MKIQYPQFPTSWTFVAGIFDACYRYHRKNGSLVLHCDHKDPLRMMQNWFPGKILCESNKYTMTIYGGLASILLSIVGPLSKHDISWEGQTLDIDYVDLPKMDYLAENDAYMIGFFYATIGTATSEKKRIEYPFHEQIDECNHVSIAKVPGKDSIDILLNSGLVVLHHTISHALPKTPESLSFKSALCYRNRLVVEAARKLCDGKRFRRPALTLEQQSIIDHLCSTYGLKGICSNLGISPAMVQQYVERNHLDRPPKDPIRCAIEKYHTQGLDRHAIRYNIRKTLGCEISVDAVSSRLHRYKKQTP